MVNNMDLPLYKQIIEVIRNSDVSGPRGIAKQLRDPSESEIKDAVMDMLDRSIIYCTGDRKLIVDENYWSYLQNNTWCP